MKTTRYILLFVGLVALAISVFGLIKGDVFTDHILGIVCGVSLTYGYFQLKNRETVKC